MVAAARTGRLLEVPSRLGDRPDITLAALREEIRVATSDKG
jgi:hypothetical protein